MSGFAEVCFKGSRKEYFAYAGLDLRPGQHVIVQADRGEDLGEVDDDDVTAGHVAFPTTAGARRRASPGVSRAWVRGLPEGDAEGIPPDGH